MCNRNHFRAVSLLDQKWITAWIVTGQQKFKKSQLHDNIFSKENGVHVWLGSKENGVHVRHSGY